MIVKICIKIQICACHLNMRYLVIPLLSHVYFFHLLCLHPWICIFACTLRKWFYLLFQFKGSDSLMRTSLSSHSVKFQILCHIFSPPVVIVLFYFMKITFVIYLLSVLFLSSSDSWLSQLYPFCFSADFRWSSSEVLCYIQLTVRFSKDLGIHVWSILCQCLPIGECSLRVYASILFFWHLCSKKFST